MARTQDPELERVRSVFERHGPLLRTTQLLAAKVHPRTLYRLRDSGDLERVASGLYRLRSGTFPANYDLMIVARKIPKAVVCLISALAFHELTDEIPHEVSIALPAGARAPRISAVPLHVFRFSETAYRLGVESHEKDGVAIRVYSPAKTIVDAFRFRNQIGEDVAVKALREALRARRVRAGAVLDIASKLRARRVIEPYLKALT